MVVISVSFFFYYLLITHKVGSRNSWNRPLAFRRVDHGGVLFLLVFRLFHDGIGGGTLLSTQDEKYNATLQNATCHFGPTTFHAMECPDLDLSCPAHRYPWCHLLEFRCTLFLSPFFSFFFRKKIAKKF